MQIDQEIEALSGISPERVFVEEPDKLREIGIHTQSYRLPKVLSSSRKAKKKRISRKKGKVTKTQILEEKQGLDREEVIELLEQSEYAKNLNIKELSPVEFEAYTKRLLQYYATGEIDYFVCDLETHQLEWYHPDGEIIGYAVSDPKERTGYFVGVNHPELAISPEDRVRVTRCIEKLHRSIPLVNHNLIFDLHWLVEKTNLQPRDFKIKADTYFLSGLVVGRDQAMEAGHKLSLKDMAARILNVDFPWGDLVSDALDSIRLKINRTFWNLKYEMVSIYAQLDGIINVQLYEALWEMVLDYDMEYIHAMMNRVIIPFLETEHNGVKWDRQLWEGFHTDYVKRMERINSAFATLPMVKAYNKDHKKPFLITSPDNVRELFFTPKYYCLESIAVTDSGKASTSEKVLKEIATTTNNEFREERKAASTILQYRKVSKLESTYIRPIPQQSKGDYFIPNYNLIGARTGRISSYFHTIPGGNDIKRLFVSRFKDEGGVILSGDYSQLEVRVFAGVSGDEVLKEAYKKGYDVHSYVASQIFKKPVETINPKQRSEAKAVVFGILYGKEVRSLAKDLSISEQEAQELMDYFYVGFPKVKEFVDHQHRFVKKHGYIVMPWGRRRWLPWIKERKEWMRDKALRQSQNSIIQGAASDITLDSYGRMQDQVVEDKIRSLMIGTVHDSIQSDTAPEDIFHMTRLMRYHAETYPNSHPDFNFMNGVPLRFDFEIGTSWGGALDIDEFLGEGHWKLTGYELDTESLVEALEKNYKVTTTGFEKSKEEAVKIFRSIDPGDKYHFELKAAPI